MKVPYHGSYLSGYGTFFLAKFTVVFYVVIGYNISNLKCATTLVILNLHLL